MEVGARKGSGWNAEGKSLGRRGEEVEKKWLGRR